jgi:hypothetical protein
MPSKTTSRKTATGNGSSANGQTAGRAVAKRPARSSSGAAVKKSAEIKPRRALAATAQRLKSPKVLVPLTVAVGLCVAAVSKLLHTNGNSKATLPRLTKEISPRFSEAVHALAELGRELRAKIR